MVTTSQYSTNNSSILSASVYWKPPYHNSNKKNKQFLADNHCKKMKQTLICVLACLLLAIAAVSARPVRNFRNEVVRYSRDGLRSTYNNVAFRTESDSQKFGKAFKKLLKAAKQVAKTYITAQTGVPLADAELKFGKIFKKAMKVAKQVAKAYVSAQTGVPLADHFLDSYFPNTGSRSGVSYGYRCPSANCGGLVCPRGFVYDSRGCKWCECR